MPQAVSFTHKPQPVLRTSRIEEGPPCPSLRSPRSTDFSQGALPKLEERDFDLTVDYDSEVEDTLGTDFVDEVFYSSDKSYCSPELLENFVESLGYADSPSELWDYCLELQNAWCCDTPSSMLQYLMRRGVERWFRKYVVSDKVPIPKLLFGLGVILTREQRMLDDTSLLPLLKAAALRAMRHRRPPRCELSYADKSEALQDIVQLIKGSREIMVLSGAGISVSCGIPDFRSRNGLYTQLFSTGGYDLDDPQQMFDINYFKHNPHVEHIPCPADTSFDVPPYLKFICTQDIPFKFCPVTFPLFYQIHGKRGKGEPPRFFVHPRQLVTYDHPQLLRNYTQNIDGLEAKAGIKRFVQCHGSFARATCINCRASVHGEVIKDDLLARRVPLCRNCNTETDLKPKKIRRKKKKKKRNDGWESDEPEVLPMLPPGIMKPDITFFGEKLSKVFDKQVFKDIRRADLLMVIGTSLKVRPVSEIISHLPHPTKIIVINKTPLPHFFPLYQLLGDADIIVKHLSRHLGWDLAPDENIKTETADFPGEICRNTVRVKDTGRRGRVTVVGDSGVLLFKGAEGGKYVDQLMAVQKGTMPTNAKISDVVLTEPDSSESEDEDNLSASVDQPRKKPRRSLGRS